MKASNYTHVRGEVTLQLAKSYGFCWGVERAVQMAYEARKQYPTEKMWITNEIIHNPSVNQARPAPQCKLARKPSRDSLSHASRARASLTRNAPQRLAEMGVNFIEEKAGEKDFKPVRSGEVVILPAFGASVHEMKLLSERNVQIVDTTCPWVSKARHSAAEQRRRRTRAQRSGASDAGASLAQVWNAVDTHARKSHTSIIHGQWKHEETIATASFATVYLVVKNLKEATFVADYIVRGVSDKAAFHAFFHPQAMSAGFDPDRDLVRVGIANQTTMLKGETEAIGKLFQKAMMERYGVNSVNDHFMVLDTICDATQERQDAMYELVAAKPDVMLVVGGFNSSNTSHLQEISEDASVTSFWIDTAERVGPGNVILHRTAHGELVETKDWLPAGRVVIGVTSGASTPDKVVEDILDVVFAIKEGRSVRTAVAA